MRLQTKQNFIIRHLINGTICIIVVVLCVVFSNCESKSNTVYELLAFRTEIKDHCSEYTQSDWENAIEKYKNLCHELDNMSFTEEERIEIDKIKGEIAGYAANVAVQEVSDKVHDIVDEIGSFAEGFSKTFNIPK